MCDNGGPQHALILSQLPYEGEMSSLIQRCLYEVINVREIMINLSKIYV